MKETQNTNQDASFKHKDKQETSIKGFIQSITRKQYEKAALLVLLIGGFTYFLSLGIVAYDYLLTHYNGEYYRTYYSKVLHDVVFVNILTQKEYTRSTLIKESIAYAQPHALTITGFTIILTIIALYIYWYINYYYNERPRVLSYYYKLEFNERYGIQQPTYNKEKVKIKKELFSYFRNQTDISVTDVITIFHKLKLSHEPKWKKFAFAEAVDENYSLTPNLTFLQLLQNEDPRLSIQAETKINEETIKKKKSVLDSFTDPTYQPSNKMIYLTGSFLFFTQNVTILLWLSLFVLFNIRDQPIEVRNAFNDILRDISIPIFTLDILGGIFFIILGYQIFKTTETEAIKRDALLMITALTLWIIVTMSYRLTSKIYYYLLNPNITGTLFFETLLESPLHAYSGVLFVFSGILFALFIYVLMRLYQTMGAYNEISHYKLHTQWNYYLYALALGILLIGIFTALDGLNGAPKTTSQDNLMIFLGRVSKFIIAPFLGAKVFINTFKEFLSKDLLYIRNNK